MSYNKESKTEYIASRTEEFAYHLYLNNKYKKCKNESLKRVLNSFLESGWLLTEKEKEKLLATAIVIAKVKYDLHIST